MKTQNLAPEHAPEVVNAIFYIIMVCVAVSLVGDFLSVQRDYIGSEDWLGCNIPAMFSADRYCAEYSSNSTSGFTILKTRYHSQDAIEEKQRQERLAQEAAAREAFQRNWDAGKDVVLTFDIISDYTLSCRQIAYINDHFIKEVTRENAGYMRSYSSGFFSRSSHSAQIYQWVTREVLATGELVEVLSYHEMGDGSLQNVHVDHYDTSEFVMYYVENCLNGTRPVEWYTE